MLCKTFCATEKCSCQLPHLKKLWQLIHLHRTNRIRLVVGTKQNKVPQLQTFTIDVPQQALSGLVHSAKFSFLIFATLAQSLGSRSLKIVWGPWSVHDFSH